jgi:hypothetical protein
MNHTSNASAEDSEQLDESSFDGSTSMSRTPSAAGFTSGGEGSSDEGVHAIRAQLSAQQSRNVLRLRILVLSALILACAVLAVLMYQINRQAEVKTFESQYNGAAAKVIDTFQEVTDRMGAVAGLGLAYASSEQQWPFVDLKDFQELAAHARRLAGVNSVGIHPLVDGHDFDAWNQFVAQPDHQIWM